MHVNLVAKQIRFRHAAGPRAGLQDTLSMKRFQLNDRDFGRLCRQVEKILRAQAADLDHLRATLVWMESIPRKLRAYLEAKLLGDDPQYRRMDATESMVDSIDNYEAHRQQLPTSAKTDGSAMADVRLLEVFVSADAIDEESLRGLLDRLTDERDYSSNTQARIAKNWVTFFNWLGRENPAASLPRSIDKRDKADIRPEWVDRLVAHADPEWRYWLRLVQWTGCRLREGLTLRPSSFDLSRKRILIEDTKRDCVRVNPLYPAIAQSIAEYLPDLSALDPNSRVLQSVTASTAYTGLRILQERAGVPRWSPPYNSFRASRVNQLASDPTITPQQAGLLVGHSVVVASRNYLSVDDALIDRLVSP